MALGLFSGLCSGLFSGLLLGLGLVACGQSVETRPIAEVLRAGQGQNPSQAQSQRIRGTVVIQAPLLTGSFYQLQDESGSIWVRSSQVVQNGDRLTIEGLARFQTIRVSDREVGEVYFEEQQQLDRQGK